MKTGTFGDAYSTETHRISQMVPNKSKLKTFKNITCTRPDCEGGKNVVGEEPGTDCLQHGWSELSTL